MRGFVGGVVLLFSSSSCNLASGFVGDSQLPLSVRNLSSPLRSQLKEESEIVKNERSTVPFNFPPLNDDNFLQKKEVGVSPRKARIISPLQALLSAPLFFSGGARGANAFSGDYESAVKSYFPGALPSSAVLKSVTGVMNSYGSKNSVLFGTSICPDEVNTKPGKKSLATAMQENISKQNGVFNLGGLAGVPFVGLSGMGAFLSHTPSKGRVVILFGPHVGVSEAGVVGKVERIGRSKLSGACGAALGAYKAIAAEKGNQAKSSSKREELALKEALAILEAGESADSAATSRLRLISNIKSSLVQIADQTDNLEKENAALRKQIDAVGGDTIDYQEEFIIDELRPKIKQKSFDDENRAIAYVTNQVYLIIFDMLKQQLKSTWKDPSFWENIDEITLLGGVVINRGLAEDYFQPLKFETLSRKGKMIERVDLLESTFV